MLEKESLATEDMTTFKVAATDGYLLEANYYAPREANGQSMLILPATGVLRRFYNDFTAYMAGQGFHAYNFDYRGIGGSRNGSLKGFKVSAHDWAMKDAKAVIAHVKQQHPGHEFTVVGHSIGGQLLSILGNDPAIDKAMLVAAQSGYWKHWDGLGRLKMFTHTHIMLPLLTFFAGYFPAKRLNLFEDLPREAALEWAKWCRSKNYLFDHYPEAYEISARFNKPILMYSFEDDDYAPIRSVEWLKNQFSKASITHHHHKPEDFDLKEIGHFNFFKKKHQDLFWKQASKWLVEGN